MSQTNYPNSHNNYVKPEVFLFYGFGSEYVLHDLYLAMKKRQYTCLEVDALKEINSKIIIDKLADKKVIFITSAHFLLDKKNFSDFYPNNNKFYSVLEIIKLLKPIRSIYIPHDLTQPLIDKETDFLNQFDFFLTPNDLFTTIYGSYCKTEEVGWIKYLKNDRKIHLNNLKRAIWLLSDYVLYLKMGQEASLKRLKPVLDQGVSIKFPLWMECESFTQYFDNQGITVYSPYTNSIDLIMEHQIIITNGLSSINAESNWLGKTTINIMENSYYGDKKEYLTELLPELLFFEKITDFDLSKIPIMERSVALKTFNMDKTIQLITHGVK